MDFAPWQIWFIAGILLLAAEIFTAGFALAGAGVGCLAAALAAGLELGFAAQSFTFFIVSAAFLYTVKPIVEKYFYLPAGRQKTNAEALIGQKGRVSERIDPEIGRGRVLVGGDDWKAISETNAPIELNEVIEVIHVQGTELTVKKSHLNGAQNG